MSSVISYLPQGFEEGENFLYYYCDPSVSGEFFEYILLSVDVFLDVCPCLGKDAFEYITAFWFRLFLNRTLNLSKSWTHGLGSSCMNKAYMLLHEGYDGFRGDEVLN